MVFSTSLSGAYSSMTIQLTTKIIIALLECSRIGKWVGHICLFGTVSTASEFRLAGWRFQASNSTRKKVTSPRTIVSPTKSFASMSMLVLTLNIAGCDQKGAPCVHRGTDNMPLYEGCLARHETLKNVTELDPFTVLTIDYYKPGWGGYYFSDVNDKYFRILHDERVVLQRADGVEEWEGTGRNVLLATVEMLDDGGLHLLDAAADDAVVRHLVTGVNHWEGEKNFEHGYPWGPGRRYLPRRYHSNDAGFLLDLDPIRLHLLPLGSTGITEPMITTLAAVSPDGRAYAYVDSRATPSAITIVTADGDQRDPVALPLTELVSNAPDINPYEPLRSWFATSYIWETDRAGVWNIVPHRPVSASSSMTDTLEDLFTDATYGYRQCFAPGNRHCLPGWELVKEPEALTGFCCNPSATYAPTKSVKAFDARVVALSLRRLNNGGSGYGLVVESDATKLVATLERRLRKRKIPFVRADRCPDLATSHESCERKLHDTINWQHPPNNTSVLSRILFEAEKNIVFLTPTLAFGLYPDDRGRTWILPLARYVMPPKIGAQAGSTAAAAPLFHRG